MNSPSSEFTALGRFAARRKTPQSSARSSLYEQIERAVGVDAADKLIADFGGRRVYVARKPAAGDLLARSIGLGAAQAMARIFGGERVLIPTVANRSRRRVRIIAMRADSASISQIAHELRCTERYVYKVLADFHSSHSQVHLKGPPANSENQNAAHAASGEK